MPTTTKTSTGQTTDLNQSIPIPTHVGIILDGNRRWARARGLPTVLGHERGLKQIRPVLKAAFEAGVKVVSLYIFSTENWHRSQAEIDYLIQLLKTDFKKTSEQAIAEGYRLRVAGESDDRLGPEIWQMLRTLETASVKNSGPTIVFCFNYGGHQEIISAVKRLMAQKMPLEAINTDSFSNEIYLPDVPNLDLVIRTSGEKRLSGFQLWRAAYAEIIFVDKLWPDFSPADMRAALADYQQRQRRFGG